MAKRIQLTYKGETVYPRTLTDAIVDAATSKRLPVVLKELDRRAKGWTIASDPSLENTFNLLDADGFSRGSVTIPKVSALESGFYDPDTKSIVLTFEEESGIEPLRISVNAFVTAQTIGEGLELDKDGKLRIKVADDGHLRLVKGAIALDTTGIAFFEDANI